MGDLYLNVQGVSFVIFLRLAVVSHRKPASCGIFHDSRLAEGYDKTNTVLENIILIAMTRGI
jgi:hypothetical protein